MNRDDDKPTRGSTEPWVYRLIGAIVLGAVAGFVIKLLDMVAP